MRNGEARANPGHDAAPPTVAALSAVDKPVPPFDVDPEAERACRMANLAWHWIVTRSGYRSHIDRLRALQAAGAVPDETYFPMAPGAQR